MNLKLTPTTAIAIGVVLLAMVFGFYTTNNLAFKAFTNGSDVATATADDDFEFIEGANITLALDTSAKSLTITAATTGSAAFELDIGNDGADSVVLNKIATTGDTNSVFIESPADALLIDLSLNWPSADTADALSANPSDCTGTTKADSIAASGNLTCTQVSTTHILNDTILELDLDAIDAASDGEVLSFDVGTGGFEWIAAGGGSGTMTTVEDDDVQVGDADIVILNFGTGFDLTESPDTQIQIAFDFTEFTDITWGNATEACNDHSFSVTGGGDPILNYCDGYVALDQDFRHLAATESVYFDTNSSNFITIGATGNIPSDLSFKWAMTDNCSGFSNGGTLTIDATNGIVCSNDDSGAGATGTVNTIEESDVQVGGSDIVTLNFGTVFDLVESPDTQIQIDLDFTELGTTTFGSGSGFTWTFDTGATDPTLVFGTGVITTESEFHLDNAATLKFSEINGNGANFITMAATGSLSTDVDLLWNISDHCGGNTNGGALTITTSFAIECSNSVGALNDLTDVTIGTPLERQTLTYSGSLWDNEYPLDIFKQVRNVSGSPLTIGNLVYVTGYNAGQDLITVDLADADAAGEVPVIGMVWDTGGIGNNTNGEILVLGQIDGINTSSCSVNDLAYLDTTAGAFTCTKPTGATTFIQAVGIVLRSHASLGRMELEGAHRGNEIPQIADDSIWIGSSTGVPTAVTIPDCDTDLNTLNYDVTTNAMSCQSKYYERMLGFPYEGTVAVTASGGSTSFRVYARATMTIKDVQCSVNTAPTDASLIVDINLNGTTIFTTQGNRPTILTTAFTDTSGVPEVIAVADGDYFDFDIDQVGSTIAGANLMCNVRLREQIYNAN